MATRTPDGPAPKPTFVFKGVVKKLKSATMKSVPISDRMAVVRVEQVLEAPKNLAHYAGQDITVELAGREKVSAGDEFIFHASGWMFGDSIAVRSVTEEPVTKAHAALLSRGGDPAEHKANRQLQEHIDDADLVVSGQVASVALPPGVAEAARTANAAAMPVSEHDPKWRQAVISVDEIHKGTHDAKQVTVLFPASTDVRWYNAPKFQAGQKGCFILHKTKINPEEHHELRGLAVVAEARGGGAEVEVYTALHPADSHPLNQQARIKALIR
ncbi:MAG TPA: hypothetical protein VF901_01200 [Bradyrhizobium sp.]|nr:hypothetical protein [Burkholderiales bacterium]